MIEDLDSSSELSSVRSERSENSRLPGADMTSKKNGDGVQSEKITVGRSVTVGLGRDASVAANLPHSIRPSLFVPSLAPDLFEAMRIEELVLEGFKSYPVRTSITGWDSSFNAITGLNGSGKSNILDAICFVLGITNMSQASGTVLATLFAS